MIFATPDEAETAYYQAFANADINLMREVWLNDVHVSCVHPLSERIRGHRLVIASWRALFHAQGPMDIDFTSVERHLGPALAVHVGVELLRHDNRINSIVTTNIYQLSEDGWRMLLHHASPQPAVTAHKDDIVH